MTFFLSIFIVILLGTGKTACVLAGLSAAITCVLITWCLKLRFRLPQDIREKEFINERQPLLSKIRTRQYNNNYGDSLNEINRVGYRSLVSSPP